MKITTQSDIARIVGVSRITVHRALNGKGSVDPDTLMKIRKAADKYGYHPNAMARAICSRQSPIVSVALLNSFVSGAELTNIPYFEVLMGIDSALRSRRGIMFLAGMTNDRNNASRLFSENWTDRAIVVGSIPEKMLQDLKRLCTRIVFVETNDWLEFDCIRRDEEHAGRLLARKLMESEPEGVLGWIDNPAGSGRRTHFNAKENRHGFAKEVQQAGRKVAFLEIARGGTVLSNDDGKMNVLHENDSYLTARDDAAVNEFLKTCTGIGSGDMVLVNCFRLKSAKLGKSAGTDYSLGCCNDSTMASQFLPDLGRVGFDRFLLGSTAVEMLMDSDAPTASRKLRGEWIPGATMRGGR